MAEKGLSVRQQRFVDGILKGLTQENAYVAAGYGATGNQARAAASRLLTKINIQAAIEEGRKDDEREVETTRDRIIREYAKIAFCDIVNIFDENGEIKNIHDIDPETRAAIAGIDITETPTLTGTKRTTKYKLETKKGALDSLAKIKGLFVDRHQIEFNADTLKAILGGLPDELAVEVRAALLALIKK